jgi:hypothetical protein
VPVGRQFAARRLLPAFQRGQAQIEDLHLAGARHKQVVRFDVAVDHPLTVDVLEADRGLADQLTRLGNRQQAALGHQLGKVDALDELHDQ